jgi:hypothetical protein
MIMNLAKITSELLQSEYCLGKVDCFLTIFKYLEKRKRAGLPEEFEGATLSSYPELYRKNPTKAKQTMIRFFEAYLTEVDKKQQLPGDVLILSVHGRRLFPAINGGLGKALFATEEHGVGCFKLNQYTVERVFRWLE